MDNIMIFLRRFLAAMARQISTILALAAYENDRKSTSSSVGSWESLINPLQIMLFFIGIRIGFRYLMSGGSLGGSATSLYFNIVIFMAAGFTIYFPFRQLAIQALSGLKLRSPLYYKRIEPLDILLALSLNNVRALLTLTLGLMALIWGLTWDFRMDSPGLALCIYLLTVVMAIGFGICLVFLGSYNKFITRLIKRLINRILIFTSGLFFATFELPLYSRPFVTWNPVLHAVELFRYSLNNEYPIPDISLSYLIWCSLILLGFSLILYRTNESLLLESVDD
ncbi:possible ABC transporter involved in polysaccharide efflux [Synechococcus sp. CC9605]|nr:possible ABC transporter involved in polysaccharide efflux [Synechococcus sp. CC9605]